MHFPSILVLTISVASVGLLQRGPPSGVQAARVDHRANLFEPLYAYDDIDAHTVVAGSEGGGGGGGSRPQPKRSLAGAEQQPKFSSPPADSARPTLFDPSDGAIELGPKVNQQPPSRMATATTTTARAASSAGVYQGAQMSTLLPLQLASARPDTRQQQQQQQLGQLLFNRQQPAPARQQIVSTVQSADAAKNLTKRDEVNKPQRHWSALEDYYKRLEQAYKSPSPSSTSNSNPNSDGLQAAQIYYPDDHHDTKSFYPSLVYKTNYGDHSDAALPPARPPASNLYYNQSQGAPDAGSPWALPIGATAANAATTTALGHHHYQRPAAPYSNSDRGSQYANFYPEQRPISAPLPSQEPIIQQLPYSPGADNQPILILARPQQQVDQPAGQQQQQQQQFEQANNYLTLLEILNSNSHPSQNQNNHRRKHQELILGPIYNSSVESSWLLEEAYCQANRVPLTGRGETAAAAEQPLLGAPKGGGGSNSSSNLLGRLLAAEHGQLARLEPTRSPGQYPSHMGVYNGTGTGPPPDDGQFLCGATWIGQHYALTLASCVRNAAFNQTRPAAGLQLSVRTNEWQRLRRPDGERAAPTSPALLQAQTRQVRQIHVFPKYLADPTEHNLAILELAGEPLGVSPTAYPACQLRARSPLRSAGPGPGPMCWAPVRSVRMEEFVDVEGEGDTKLRANISMLEAPVQLIASDEAKCRSQTLLDHFLFNHPNYYCAADFRLAQGKWRQPLNQTGALGSGVYCHESGQLSLVSLLHPIHQQTGSPTAYGYLDLSYYGPWIRTVIYGRPY